MASTPPPPFPASAPVPHGRPDDTASRSREGGLGVAVLGSTGSIGTSTLEVIAASAGLFRPHLLAAHTSVGPLLEQARIHRPAWVVVTDPAAAATIGATALPAGTQLAVGPEALDDLVGAPEVDRVVSAIVGAAGLRSTVAALEAGKTVALANKETLVMAGPLVMRLAAERGAVLLPVDSEHSAIHQALRSGTADEVVRVILTASGGPFRTASRESLETVTPAEKLAVVVHPQSVVHSMVEFVDGSVIAQLSPPDMKLPIQYALSHPQRLDGPARRLDFRLGLRLDFEPPDPVRFPSLRLGHEAAARGGTAGAVLNAANEEAVGAFLAGRMRFTGIADVCARVLEGHAYQADPSLDDIRRLDAWARQEVVTWVSS